MFCITAVIFITDPSMLTGTGDTILNVFVPCDVTNNTIGFCAFNNSTMSQTNTESGGFGSGTYIIITDILRILAFLTTLQGFVNVAFAPAMALQKASAPIFLVIITGGVWLIMYILAIAGFARGRDV